MPDDRLIHRRLSRSEKVSSLSDLEYRVWTQYVLSADDCGIMPFTAATLQADNNNLHDRPVKVITAALARLVAVGLVRTFEHQRRRYLYQPDWQDFQGVRYPRDAHLPLPSGPALLGVTTKTLRLYQVLEQMRGKKSAGSEEDSGNGSGNVPSESEKDLGNISEIVPAPAGAGGIAKRLTANGQRLTANPDLDSSEESARETNAIAPVWRRPGDRPLSIVAHQKHAYCTMREGLCVPDFLHREFLGKLGGTHPEADLRAWYPAAVEAFDGQAIGEDSIRFWRNLFANWVGTVTSAPPPSGKASESVAAVQRMVLRRQAEREGRA